MADIRILQSLATLDRGGAETMIMNLYRKIDRSQIQFDFMVNDRDQPYAFEKEALELGGRIFTIPKFNGRNLWNYRKKINQLFLENPEWKVVHIHNTSSATLFIDIAKKHNIEPIAHMHFNHGVSDFRSFVQYILRKPIKYNVNHLLACSEASGTNGFGLNKEGFQVFKNAIETDQFVYNEKIRKQKRAELGLKHEIVLGHVGRMSDEKNHLFLIDVFRWYLQFNPNSILILIGDGELKPEIIRTINSYNLGDKVKLLGVQPNINEWLQAMDIFIFPSLNEGLGVALIEAQAAGLPIIASDSITKEVAITNLIKFRSVTESPYFWAKAIDDSLILFRKDMSQEVKQAGYDVEDTANELQEYYLSIVEGAE